MAGDVETPHASDDVADVRVPTPWETLLCWAGPPRGYQLTRWLILRLLGFVYVFAFLGLIFQGPGLLGSHGLTPVHAFVDLVRGNGATFSDLPSIFFGGASDTSLMVWAYVGLAIAICVTLGYANLPMLLALWVIYGSYERVGQLWFSFGWEIQILETTLIAAFLAHPWDPRPLAARPPTTTSIVLMRWLVFRIMLGAGLIKLRGDPCWRELTCLDWHFETQPIPNPLSPFFHYLPHAVLAGGVVFNHIVEVVAPFFVFGPRRLRLVAGCMMAGFQIVLILSGNLAFLNWLTLVPVLACFDDDFLLRLLPGRPREWLKRRLAPVPKRDGRILRIGIPIAVVCAFIWTPLVLVLFFSAIVVAIVKKWDLPQLLVAVFAGLVIMKSGPVVENLLAKRQAMNRSFDNLSLVNTYGAFGSVGDTRHEIIIEGTMSADPNAPDSEWKEYELPCKPGNVNRRPCVLGPYHRRLDWLIWFSAMSEQPSDPWLYHFAWKLLDGDKTVRELVAVDPFGGQPPRWIRMQRYVYKLQPYSAPTWWTRTLEDPKWMEPVSKDTPGFREALARFGWPSPSVK
ncbi:MAG: lipase maturation factor family protein [Kofleriaceae bacterium]|nr:lipase maturation factor family protein [Kofleriaceae bacterium]